MQVFPHGGFGPVLDAFVDLLIGADADERLVIALHQANAPTGCMDIARIIGVRQNIESTLYADFTAFRLREVGMLLQETRNLALAVKAPAGKTFKRFRDDRGDRFIANEHLAPAGCFLERITDGRAHGKTIGDPRPHALAGLLGIFDTGMLNEERFHPLHDDRIGIIGKNTLWCFHPRADILKNVTNGDVRLNRARKPGDIIDKDNMRHMAILMQVGHHIFQSRTIHIFARDIILKDFNDSQ